MSLLGLPDALVGVLMYPRLIESFAVTGCTQTFRLPNRGDTFVVMVLDGKRYDDPGYATADEYLHRLGWVYDPEKARRLVAAEPPTRQE